MAFRVKDAIILPDIGDRRSQIPGEDDAENILIPQGIL